MRQKSSWILTECQTCMPVIEVCLSQYTIKEWLRSEIDDTLNLSFSFKASLSYYSFIIKNETDKKNDMYMQTNNSKWKNIFHLIPLINFV